MAVSCLIPQLLGQCNLAHTILLFVICDQFWVQKHCIGINPDTIPLIAENCSNTVEHKCYCCAKAIPNNCNEKPVSHLGHFSVPLLVHVPPFENHWFIWSGVFQAMWAFHGTKMHLRIDCSTLPVENSLFLLLQWSRFVFSWPFVTCFRKWRNRIAQLTCMYFGKAPSRTAGCTLPCLSSSPLKSPIASPPPMLTYHSPSLSRLIFISHHSDDAFLLWHARSFSPIPMAGRVTSSHVGCFSWAWWTHLNALPGARLHVGS